ncbi:MAG: IS5 family transposase [Luteolibacter sp.]
MGKARRLGQTLAPPPTGCICRRPDSFHRLHCHPCSSARRRSAKKNGGDQALGRSRGGLTTKIHAACVDEIRSVGLILSPGQNADCRHFDELFDTLDKDNVLEASALDKGDDTNAIRDRLAEDGIEPVIPSKSNRRAKFPHDVTLYKERNRVERFFNRIKHFRRIATRYEKYESTFLAMIQLVSAFLYIR